MTDLARVERKIRNAQTIRDIVSSMRALAAIQVRQSADALKRLREYESDLRAAFRVLPDPPPRQRGSGLTLLLIWGTDQGLCGPLSRRMVEQIRHIPRLRSPDLFYAVGHRTATLLADRGHALLGWRPSPLSMRGIDALVEDLARVLRDAAERRSCTAVDALYPQHRGAGRYQPVVDRILPVPWAPAEQPVRAYGPPIRAYEPTSTLVEKVLNEIAYTRLYRMCLEGLASEQGARLETTNAAARAIDRRLEDLRVEHNHQRQEAITMEIQEIAASAKQLLAEG